MSVNAMLREAVANFDPEAVAAREAADAAVAPRGFTVRRFADRVRVTHNRSTRNYVFYRDRPDEVHWSRPAGVRGHRMDGWTRVENYTTGNRGTSEDRRAAAWYCQAVEGGYAFTEQD